MRRTITEALNAMRRLNSVDAGRLRGISLNHSFHDLTRAAGAGARQPWGDQFQAALAARASGTITPDSPDYVVLSDGVAVVWLTLRGRTITPDRPLSTNQTKHQRQAIDALTDLHRHALGSLADRRAALDGRHGDVEENAAAPIGALRVAPLSDPTDAHWVTISADRRRAHRRIAAVCDPEQLLIVTACGYGAYGRERHRLELDILCAMHQVANTRQLTLSAIGDWLHAEGATRKDLTPQALVDQFTDAYIGPFATESDYTAHHMAELGWTQAITAAAIPDRYINTAAITRDLFDSHVRRINSDRRIEVFRR